MAKKPVEEPEELEELEEAEEAEEVEEAEEEEAEEEAEEAPADNKEYITPNHLAEKLGTKPATVRRYLRTLPGFQDSTYTRYKWEKGVDDKKVEDILAGFEKFKESEKVKNAKRLEELKKKEAAKKEAAAKEAAPAKETAASAKTAKKK